MSVYESKMTFCWRSFVLWETAEGKVGWGLYVLQGADWEFDSAAVQEIYQPKEPLQKYFVYHYYVRNVNEFERKSHSKGNYRY